MPLPRFVQQLARNYLQNAYARILRGFSSLEGRQDRLGGLDGRRSRTCAFGCATGRTNKMSGRAMARTGLR